MSSNGTSGHQRRWLLAGVVVTLLAGALALVLNLLLDWPGRAWAGLLVGLVALPAAALCGRAPRLAGRSQSVLVHVLVASGLIAMVAAIYLLFVVGLGGSPDDSEQTVLVLSMGAAALAAILATPMRRMLTEWANQQVYGEIHSPDDALRTFGGRMSRAVPMDELLLQLVETLTKTMELSRAEVWTGTDGTLNLVASMPDRRGEPLQLGASELSIAARAHAQGNSWLEVWIPQLLEGRVDSIVRSVSVAHLGQLQGLIVLERPPAGQPFNDEEDAALVELARQLGLALHNVSLDSALQASLDELAQRNRELSASRARIVQAADESRRAIERNLHDGAQQHLVALAVKTGLIRSLLASDPEAAGSMLEELRGEIQATLTELRELAHGIYPPLLRERGLPEALQTVANRAVLSAEVKTSDLGRFDPDLEAAVYFCCVEAVQNAGKYAGESAHITITVESDEGSLCFLVEDDGCGFDTGLVKTGQGFVNMADRLGAFDGLLEVESEPGVGATVRGTIPLANAQKEA